MLSKSDADISNTKCCVNFSCLKVADKATLLRKINIILSAPISTMIQYLYSLLTSDGVFCHDKKKVCSRFLKVVYKYRCDMQASVKCDGGRCMSKFQQLLKQSPDESVSDVPDIFQDVEAVKMISSSPVTDQTSGTLSVLSPNIAHSQSDSVPITAVTG